MIISFETKQSKVLDEFLDRYENPNSLSAKISKNSFLEFKIHRIKDLVVISQKHLFDVVAKWLLMASIIDLLFAYSYGWKALFMIGGLFAFTSIMWLSKYLRFFALRINLWKKGHKDKVTFVNDALALEKVLLFMEDNNVGYGVKANGSKRYL